MPLAPQRLHHHIRHRLPALAALGAVPISVAIATPRISILLDERRAGIEWVTTLRTEEMAGVPFGATSNNDFAFDRRLARLAARAEHFVEVERAVEAHRGLAISYFRLVQVLVRDVVWDVASVAGCDALQACNAFGIGFGVESDVLEVCVALVAVEAGWVKALPSCRENTTGDGKGTVSAEGARLAKRGSVVGC
jgi:hypothetical protein